VRSQLRRLPYGYRINRKRIQRSMRQEGLLRPVKRRKVRTYAAHAYVDRLRAFQVQLSLAAVGEAEENGHAERLMHIT
jgi:transposase InsO family protein